MPMDLSGNPFLPYVVGLSCLLLSAFLTYRRLGIRPMKRFDVVEHGIVPTLVLLVLVTAACYVDLESHLSLGITLFFIVLLGGVAVPLGPVGWAAWLVLLFLFLSQGNSILVVIAAACMAMLAGTAVGFGFALCKERRRRNQAPQVRS